MFSQKKKACVTGGTGFLASILIKQLLQKGYVVNTTVRDPDNQAKISHLKKLDSAGNALKLFRAELSDQGSFDEAISGCDYVFHVAAPVDAMSDDPENVLIKPAIQGTLNVMKSCMKAKTVKRIVCTSSAAAVSVNRLEGTGFVLNEDSWSDTDFMYAEQPPTWGYIVAKTLAEKAAWKFAEENKIDLVTIVPSLVMGSGLSEKVPFSLQLPLSLFIELVGKAMHKSFLGPSGNSMDFPGDENLIGGMKVMQKISGSISIVHVEDVCEAHIFTAETESASGRYICTAVNTSLPELSVFLSKRYPQYKVPTEFSDVATKAKLSLSSEKLTKAGFGFKYKTLEDIFDETVEYLKTVGVLST